MVSIPKTSGIYKITCIANGKIYVGSSHNFRERWRGHLKLLRKGKHHSPHFQNAWDKYGESAFEFEIIELVMPWALTDREDYWLNKLNPCDPTIGFNVAPNATFSTYGLTHTPERKAKISERMKGNQFAKGRKIPDEERAERSRAVVYREFTDEHKAKISAAKMGHGFTDEGIKNLSSSHMKRYIVIDPNGVETEITGLVKFCKEHGLQRVNMGYVAHGKQIQHRGWKCRLIG